MRWMMTTDKLYVEVDLKNKIILSSPAPLELNWKNIGGLPFLEEHKLQDLSWAGYENYGFIKFHNDNRIILRCFSCDFGLLEKIKSELKIKVSEIRYAYECGGVVINDQYVINTDDRSKLLIQMKYLQCKENLNSHFSWKTSSGSVEFDSPVFINLYMKIMDFIQNCFDLESSVYDNINQCKDIIDVLNINLHSIDWNFNKITI